MKIQSLPLDVLVEILHYLADYESLEGLEQILDRKVGLSDVRSAFRELAVQLKEEVEGKKLEGATPTINRLSQLSPNVKKVLSRLSPLEEKRLLGLFGLLGE